MKRALEQFSYSEKAPFLELLSDENKGATKPLNTSLMYLTGGYLQRPNL